MAHDDKHDEEIEDMKPWAIVLALTEDMETALTEKACQCAQLDGEHGCPQCSAVTTARNRAQRRIEELLNAPRSSVAANKDEPSELVKRISAYSYADADAVAKLEREAAEWKRKFYGEAVDRAPRSATAVPLVQVAWAKLKTRDGHLLLDGHRDVDDGPGGYRTHAVYVRDPAHVEPESYVSHKGSKT